MAGWKSVPTNKKVGGLFPNDGDGNAWGDKKLGFPKPLADAGFTLIDPGRFQNMNNDFSAQIAAFKKEGVEIVTGVVIPPDAKTFLTQAKQQGFHPKVVTLGKALLFPTAIEALGGDGLSTEVWWTPEHPFSSSLTKQSARQLGDSYESTTKKQWTQCIGFVHALFEVAVDVLKRTKDLGSAALDPRRDRRHQHQDRRRRGEVGRRRSVQERVPDAAGAGAVEQGHQAQIRARDREQPGGAEPSRRAAS